MTTGERIRLVYRALVAALWDLPDEADVYEQFCPIIEAILGAAGKTQEQLFQDVRRLEEELPTRS